MLPESRDAALLLDMLEAAEKVRRYVRDKTFEDFRRDGLLRDAVERNIEIIGEAARAISDESKAAHSEIPWRKIIAQRNVIVHQYRSIGEKEIWEVAEIHVPDLIASLRPLLPPLPPEEPGN
jgi:uncharacterized protein with HEPN domain